ncbi:MAG: Hsp20/alpha crystallin family protein [Pseudomonadota bacterium]|nr:Hsp20/alpha crystallin family protein [Pseudomonadota bacterium]
MKNLTAGGANNRSRHSEPATSNHSGNDFNNFMNYFWNYTDMPESITENLEPHIRVVENKDSVKVTAELPSIPEDKIDLQISADGYLSISGEKKDTNISSADNSYFSEISYGMFKRTIPLPWDLAYDNAAATYTNGVLTVLIPKTQVEKQKFKKIAIKTTSKN